MYIIVENTGINTIPKKIKKDKSGNIRFEAVLQTAGDINRNRRRYGRDLLESGLAKISQRVKEGAFIGELDHPIDTNPIRQTTCLYKEASHRIIDYGWDGNKLVGILETLRTPNGEILKNLAEDGIPVGFSFRGMGDLREVNENTGRVFEVMGPLHVITWDSVSYPSHAEAKLIRITEALVSNIYSGVSPQCSLKPLYEAYSFIHDSKGIKECDNLICTQEGICYLPTEFDQLVEQRVIQLKQKFGT